MTPAPLTAKERAEIETRPCNLFWIGRLLAAEQYQRERADAAEKRTGLFIDAVRRLAFEMPPPNTYTPRFVQLCIEARAALAEEPKP